MSQLRAVHFCLRPAVQWGGRLCRARSGGPWQWSDYLVRPCGNRRLQPSNSAERKIGAETGKRCEVSDDRVRLGRRSRSRRIDASDVVHGAKGDMVGIRVANDEVGPKD